MQLLHRAEKKKDTKNGKVNKTNSIRFVGTLGN